MTTPRSSEREAAEARTSVLLPDEAASSAGDPIPTGSETIEVRVAELQQLFNAIDASPFRNRDLDPGAEDFIVSWAREAPRDAKLALLIRVQRAPGPTDEPAALRDVVHEFFAQRAEATRSRLRELFRIGRISMVVGLMFLSVAVVLAGVVSSTLRGHRLGELMREGLVISGWVAMWRPLEIFLYGWWPIRTQARLYDRLSLMPVRLAYVGDAPPESWRSDWPAVSATRTPPQKARPRGPSPARGSQGSAPGRSATSSEP